MRNAVLRNRPSSSVAPCTERSINRGFPNTCQAPSDTFSGKPGPRFFATTPLDLTLDRLRALAPEAFFAFGCAGTCFLIWAVLAGWPK